MADSTITPIRPASETETYLTPQDLMRRYPKVSSQTLANWRSGNNRVKCGPPFLKAGGHILYPLSKLLVWETRMTSMQGMPEGHAP